MTDSVLKVKDLAVGFRLDGRTHDAVRGIDFEIPKGKTIGLVGESGSGKSVTAFSILKLIDPPGEIHSGKVLFQGQDLLELSEEEIRRYRGNAISMIFQEPMTSLNPVYTIGQQISEIFTLHQSMSQPEAKEASIEMLRKVKIPDAARRYDDYPHQLSGGMRQRVMIAMALACDPELLIADEPTTALDVTIQAQILELIAQIQEHHEMSMLLITHDLGVVSEVCDEVLVMYAGAIVEHAKVEDFFANPQHPYSLGLLRSIPSLQSEGAELPTIPGTTPGLVNQRRVGCAFYDRCSQRESRCSVEEPKLKSIVSGHQVACWQVESRQESGQ